MSRGALPALGIATVLFAVGMGCGAEPQYVEPPPPKVTVIEVSEQEVSDQLEFAGQLQAVNTVDLRARVEGELLERNFDEGSEVERDRLLLLIDAAPFRAELNRLQAEVVKASATVIKAMI